MNNDKLTKEIIKEWDNMKKYLLLVHKEYSDRNGLPYCKNCGIDCQALVSEIEEIIEKVRLSEQIDRASQISHAFNKGYRSRDSELPKSYQKGYEEGHEVGMKAKRYFQKLYLKAIELKKSK